MIARNFAIAAAIACTSYGIDAHACSCFPVPEHTLKLENKLVFKGRIIKVEYDVEGYKRWATFEVHRAYRGVTKDTVRVGTPLQGSGCGLRFDEGEDYFVFVDNKDLWAEQCGLTVPWRHARKWALKQLGPGTPRPRKARPVVQSQPSLDVLTRTFENAQFSHATYVARVVRSDGDGDPVSCKLHTVVDTRLGGADVIALGSELSFECLMEEPLAPQSRVFVFARADGHHTMEARESDESAEEFERLATLGIRLGQAPTEKVRARRFAKALAGASSAEARELTRLLFRLRLRQKVLAGGADSSGRSLLLNRELLDVLARTAQGFANDGDKVGLAEVSMLMVTVREGGESRAIKSQAQALSTRIAAWVRALP